MYENKYLYFDLEKKGLSLKDVFNIQRQTNKHKPLPERITNALVGCLAQ